MEGIRGHTHPLQDADILENIFKDLRVTDLLNCRQVCRAWRQASNTFTRTVVKVNIDWNRNGRGIPEFLNLLRSEWSTFSESPFVNTFEFSYGVANNPEFWNFCGNHIKSLKFIGFEFPTAQIFIQIIIQSCPNLEELDLFNVEITRSGPINSTQYPPNKNLKSLALRIVRGSIPWSTILAHSPSVESLNWNLTGRESADFLRSLETHRLQNDNFWKLKKLEFTFDAYQDDQNVDLFAVGDFPLENLTIHCIESLNIVTTRRILTAHSKTLKKVHLSGYVGSDVEDMFPLPGNIILDKVKDLCLQFRTINPHFLVFVPNFEKLTLDVGVGGFQGDYRMDDVVVSSCTELKVRPIQKNDLKLLCGWLPNLQVLETMGTDNEEFAIICELCPNLRSLFLEYSVVDDCGITGLDEGDVEKINREGVDGDRRPFTVPRANITNLKCLQKLKMTWETGRKGADICSIVCGVQQLPQLKHLSVVNRECSEEAGALWRRLHAQYPWNTLRK